MLRLFLNELDEREPELANRDSLRLWLLYKSCSGVRLRAFFLQTTGLAGWRTGWLAPVAN